VVNDLAFAPQTRVPDSATSTERCIGWTLTPTAVVIVGSRRQPERITIMTDQTVTATTTITAPAESVFAVLADPTKHAAIDGTGWVREYRNSSHVTEIGQVFRMAMYHPNHPDGHYEIANKVRVFDPPRAISWEPGTDTGEGTLSFGGWIWRYDLISISPEETKVTLTYDWSAVPQSIRDRIGFPPFGPGHLTNSLAHLAKLVTEAR
jgi:uncharacterized protein YndB with AHSA1/START domain